MHNIQPRKIFTFCEAFLYEIIIRTATISRNGMSDIKYPRLQYRIQLMFHVQLVLWYRPLNVPGIAFRFLRESVRKVEASSSPL